MIASPMRTTSIAASMLVLLGGGAFIGALTALSRSDDLAGVYWAAVGGMALRIGTRLASTAGGT